MLLGERGCGKHWSQGKSLWGNPKPPPTAVLLDLLVEFCNGMAVGTLGIQAVFQRSLQLGPPLQPWFPYLSCQSSLDPLFPGWKAAGYAVPDTSTELLCCCHCCCCCSRKHSQGCFKLGTFSNIWVSVVFKRLFVTQSDFSARHMGRSPETPQCGCSLSNLPMFLHFLGPR